MHGSDFTKGDMMRHVTVMSFTSSIGIMAIYLVDLLDIFFISLLGEEEMAAAAGFASTLMFFISAINIGLSVATGSLVSQRLGSKKQDEARKITACALVLAIGVGLTLPFLMMYFAHDLVGFIGAEGSVAEKAVLYLYIVLPASVLSGLSMVLVGALRAQGDAKGAMYPSLSGAAVNLVFDPILIFGLGLDLAGAAFATVLARLATLIVAFHLTRKAGLLTRPNAVMIRKRTREILSYALPAMLASVATPIGMALITRYMAKFGADAVAAIAVIGRLSPVVFSVVNALAGAIGPIIGQNFGVGRLDRVKDAYGAAIKFLVIYVVIAITILFLLRSQIADAFGAQGVTRDLLYLYCGPFALVAFFNGMLFISTAAYTNLGHPGYATGISWARNTLGLFVFLAIGNLFGLYGVVFSILACAAFFALLSVIIARRIMVQLRAKSAAAEKELVEDMVEDFQQEKDLRSMLHQEPIGT